MADYLNLASDELLELDLKIFTRYATGGTAEQKQLARAWYLKHFKTNAISIVATSPFTRPFTSAERYALLLNQDSVAVIFNFEENMKRYVDNFHTAPLVVQLMWVSENVLEKRAHELLDGFGVARKGKENG